MQALCQPIYISFQDDVITQQFGETLSPLFDVDCSDKDNCITLTLSDNNMINNDSILILDQKSTLASIIQQIYDKSRYKIKNALFSVHHNMIYNDECCVNLTPLEAIVIQCIIHKLSKKEILSHLGWAENTETHTLDTHIWRIKQKILPLQLLIESANNGWLITQ